MSEHADSAPVDPHGVPTAGELVEAVREWMERDLAPALDGRLRFHTRVAANMLAIVEREMALGADQALAHGRRLSHLGMADDVELAAAIRRGDLDDRLGEVRHLLREAVTDKLRVANPNYLDD